MCLEKEIQEMIDEKEKNNMIRYRFEFDDENGNTYPDGFAEEVLK